MKTCSFCSSKKSAFLLKPEVKTHLKIPQELWASFNFICADHFEPSSLTNGERKRLKYDAFPTIFPQPLESYFKQFFDAEVREGVNKNIATGKCHQPSLLFTSFHYSSFSNFYMPMISEWLTNTISISNRFFDWFIKHQDSEEDGSIHPASLASTQKTHSQESSEFQLPDGGNEDRLGLSSDEEDHDEEEQEDEESKDAKFVLVSKESLWQLLSKCQQPGCSEYCEISSHSKGQTFQPFLEWFKNSA